MAKAPEYRIAQRRILSRVAPRPFNRLHIAFLLVFATSIAGSLASPGDENWDDRFALPDAGGINSFAISGTDRNVLYAGGNFGVSAVGVGGRAQYVARWNGRGWTALGTNINDTVNTVVTSGNDVYVGGVFTFGNNANANYLAKWDGSNWSSLCNRSQ